MPGKPIEKVRTGRELAAAIRATTVEEFDAAREQRAQRHVGDQPVADGAVEQGFELHHGIVVGPGEGVPRRCRGHVARGPVGDLAGVFVLVCADPKVAAGLQATHVPIDGVLAGIPAVARVPAQRPPVDLACEVGMGAQGAQLGTEQEGPAEPAVIQRLLADPIACQRELAQGFVPKGEGEHAFDALERRLDAPHIDGGEQHLGIRSTEERVPVALHFRPQVAEIIDLAIEHDDEPTADREHRLVARWRWINHRQPPMPERDAGLGVDPDALAVRPAMGDRSGHGAHDGGIGAGLAPAVQDPSNTAHRQLPPTAGHLHPGLHAPQAAIANFAAPNRTS